MKFGKPLSFLTLVLYVVVGSGCNPGNYQGGTGRPIRSMPVQFNDEKIDDSHLIIENKFADARANPLSTFSTDVDTASYSLMRGSINSGRLPAPNEVRVEEFVNYFKYDYQASTTDSPIASHLEVATAPWQPAHRLLRIALSTDCWSAEKQSAIPLNLVFLIDVSGSMAAPHKLELVKSTLRILVDRLGSHDRVAIVTYAGRSGVHLNATSGDQKELIVRAFNQLRADGATNGAGGLELAYQIAEENLREDGINRVILATDGDFNVGPNDPNALASMVSSRRDRGILLTVLGFGDSARFSDSRLEILSNRADGNYAFIDTEAEARRVFGAGQGSVLYSAARDVKLQVEFNPKHVKSYRLLGYENRLLEHASFNNDQTDAGDMGPGHQVTALYEIIPETSEEKSFGAEVIEGVDPLIYQTKDGLTERGQGREMVHLKIRYRPDHRSDSKLQDDHLALIERSFEDASDDFRFAAIVAGFAMQLRGSRFVGDSTLEDTEKWLSEITLGADEDRLEFKELVFQSIRLRNLDRNISD